MASFDNDSIFGGGGDDVINVQDGPGIDHVECGEGTDTVFFDATDTVLDDCEIQHSQ